MGGLHVLWGAGRESLNHSSGHLRFQTHQVKPGIQFETCSVFSSTVRTVWVRTRLISWLHLYCHSQDQRWRYFADLLSHEATVDPQFRGKTFKHVPWWALDAPNFCVWVCCGGGGTARRSAKSSILLSIYHLILLTLTSISTTLHFFEFMHDC